MPPAVSYTVSHFTDVLHVPPVSGEDRIERLCFNRLSVPHSHVYSLLQPYVMSCSLFGFVVYRCFSESLEVIHCVCEPHPVEAAKSSFNVKVSDGTAHAA